MPQHEDTIEVIVSVDEAHRDNLEAVTRQLEAAGMLVEQTLARIGVVTGKAPASQRSHLAQIEGVSSVEVSQEYTAQE